MPEAALIGWWYERSGKHFIARTMTESAQNMALLNELIEAGS